jgi:hypothetical protein
MRLNKWLYLLPMAVAAGLGIGVFTRVVAQSPGVNSPYQPTWSIPIDSIKRTYSNVAQLSPGAFATDISTFCGAAGVTTKLSRVQVMARATAVSPLDIYLIKRSNWDTGGTVANGVSQTGVPYDINDAASKAAVTYYTNSSNGGTTFNLGTLIGIIGVTQTYFGNLTVGEPGEPAWVFDYLNRPTKNPTLRSATDCLALNLSGTSQGANLLDITWEWTEE